MSATQTTKRREPKWKPRKIPQSEIDADRKRYEASQREAHEGIGAVARSHLSPEMIARLRKGSHERRYSDFRQWA